MKQIKADNVIKTINWISNKDDYDSVFAPIKKDDLYVCEIYLPLINKTVIGVGKTKIDSIDNATNESSALIDDYLTKNPICEFNDYFIGREYVIEEDDDGFLSIHIIQPQN